MLSARILSTIEDAMKKYIYYKNNIYNKKY